MTQITRTEGLVGTPGFKAPVAAATTAKRPVAGSTARTPLGTSDRDDASRPFQAPCISNAAQAHPFLGHAADEAAEEGEGADGDGPAANDGVDGRVPDDDPKDPSGEDGDGASHAIRFAMDIMQQNRWRRRREEKRREEKKKE